MDIQTVSKSSSEHFSLHMNLLGTFAQIILSTFVFKEMGCVATVARGSVLYFQSSFCALAENS